MRFDKKTLTSWKERGIKEISCLLVKKGCAGEKLSISEKREPKTIFFKEEDGISYFIQRENYDFFRESMITQVNKKWIIKSDKILDHCGCGTSFLRQRGNSMLERIQLLKLKMRKKRGDTH